MAEASTLFTITGGALAVASIAWLYFAALRRMRIVTNRLGAIRSGADPRPGEGSSWAEVIGLPLFIELAILHNAIGAARIPLVLGLLGTIFATVGGVLRVK